MSKQRSNSGFRILSQRVIHLKFPDNLKVQKYKNWVDKCRRLPQPPPDPNLPTPHQFPPPLSTRFMFPRSQGPPLPASLCEKMAESRRRETALLDKSKWLILIYLPF